MSVIKGKKSSNRGKKSCHRKKRQEIVDEEISSLQALYPNVRVFYLIHKSLDKRNQ